MDEMSNEQLLAEQKRLQRERVPQRNKAEGVQNESEETDSDSQADEGKEKSNKRFWWFKLSADFFSSKEIRALRLKGGDKGDSMLRIYQMLILSSLKTGGYIEIDNIVDDYVTEVSLVLGENDLALVKQTLALLEKVKLIQMTDECIFIPEVSSRTGSETKDAERKRKQRAKEKEDRIDDADL